MENEKVRQAQLVLDKLSYEQRRDVLTGIDVETIHEVREQLKEILGKDKLDIFLSF